MSDDRHAAVKRHIREFLMRHYEDLVDHSADDEAARKANEAAWQQRLDAKIDALFRELFT